MAYAEGTAVAVEKSRGEIERILQRYGADQFMYGWTEADATIAFRAQSRMVRFVLPMAPADEVWTTPSGRRRQNQADARSAEERRRWRALALVIKAKLEAVESGITTFEDEFLAHTLLPSGETVSDWMQPQVEEAYSTGAMPLMLAAPKADD